MKRSLKTFISPPAKKKPISFAISTLTTTLVVAMMMIVPSSSSHHSHHHQMMMVFADATSTEGLHSPSWDPIMVAQTPLSLATNSTQWSAGRNAALAALANGVVPFFFDYLPFRPEDFTATGASADQVVSVNFAEAGVCAGFNIGGEFSFTLPPLQLAQLLLGNLSQLPVNLTVGAGSVGASEINIVLPSATAEQFLEIVAVSVADDNIGFTPAAALNNPKLSLLASEGACLEYVRSNNKSLTLSSKVSSVKSSVPCIQLEVPHLQFPLVTVPIDPTAITSPTLSQITRYPLIQGAYIHLSTQFACDQQTENLAFRELEVLVRSEVTDSLSLWGLKAVDFSAQLTFLIDAFTNEHLCGRAEVIPSGGSSAILPLAQAWSISYLNLEVDKLVLLDYPGGGSGAGLRGIKSKSFQIAGSDSLFSETEYEEFPSVQFLPATAFAVSVIVNVPGATSLVLPRCVVVAIFTGKILYWNHPDISIHNPSVLLPEVRINVFARSTRSGTTGIFLGGMTALNDVCLVGPNTIRLDTPVNETSTWNLFFPGLVLRTSTGRVVSAVQETPYSIGYGSSGAARVAGLVEASLIDDSSQAVAGPTVASVTSALEAATLNTERLTFSFQVSPTAYPFVGITYFVYHRAQEGNCSRFRNALDLVLWSGTSPTASKQAQELNYVPLPRFIVEQVQEKIYSDSLCDGGFLYPEQQPAPPAKAGVNVVAASVGAMAGVIFLVVVVLALYLIGARNSNGRDNKYAPKDDTKDISIIFTDIESSTSLWARGPTSMGPALDIHNEVIRHAIAKNKCYEVKTIGDAFMIACITPEQALNCISEIQLGLRDANWEGHDDEINTLYDELHAEAGWSPATIVKDKKLWNGLRVRIGIATGKPSIRFDEVTGGFDYFGQTSNLAARIESVANGGQVMCCSTTVKFATEGSADQSSLCVEDMGTHELKGIDEPVPLFQVLPKDLSGRRFGELRKSPQGNGNAQGLLSRRGSSSVATEKSVADTWTRITENDGTGSFISSDGRSGVFEVREDRRSGASSRKYHRNNSQSEESSTSSVVRRTADHIFIDTLFSAAKEKERLMMVRRMCEMWRIPHAPEGRDDRAVAKLCERIQGVMKVKGQSASASSSRRPSGSSLSGSIGMNASMASSPRPPNATPQRPMMSPTSGEQQPQLLGSTSESHYY